MTPAAIPASAHPDAAAPVPANSAEDQAVARKTFPVILAMMLTAACGQKPAPPAPKPSIYAQNQCGGASPAWSPQGSELGDMVLFNRLDITPRGLKWNDQPVDRQMLRRYLREASNLKPTPITTLVVDRSATCTAVAAVRNAMDGILKCSSKWKCVEYADIQWAKKHPPLPPCDADCQAYGRANGSDRFLSADQKQRLKRNYIDTYGFIPW
jgi:hypothetical protein